MSKKITKAQIKDFVQHQLRTNEAWASKGLVAIYNRQTADEQNAGKTEVDNGIGFTGLDAEFATSLAKGILKYGRLTERQLPYLFKLMPKYWAQIVEISDEAKLRAKVEASLAAAPAPEPAPAA